MSSTLFEIAESLSDVARTVGAKIYTQKAPDNAPVPFLVVALNAERVYDETTIEGQAEALSSRVLVTATAGTSAGAENLGRVARQTITPHAAKWRVFASGGTVRWERLEELAEDRDYLIPGTQRHPWYAVHSFEFITSE